LVVSADLGCCSSYQLREDPFCIECVATQQDSTMLLTTLFRAGGPSSWRSIQVCAVGWSNEVNGGGALCNVHCALCAAHDSPRAAKAMPMEEFVYCSRSWLRREAPVLLARSLAVNRASTPPFFFGLVALVGLVTARCPLGSSDRPLPGLGSAPPPMQAHLAHVSGVFAT
jgi:hypothetical protein